jgi:MerR-like DNA binding protein
MTGGSRGQERKPTNLGGPERDELVFDVHELALRCGVDVDFLQELVDLGVIEPLGESSARSARDREAAAEVTLSAGRVSFSCEVSLRVGKFVRLQRHLGVNTEGSAIILDLLDRIDELERELRSLKRG